MGALGIIAGLILLLAGSSWFTGAVTVGWILLIGGAVLTVVPLVIALVAFIGISKKGRRF
jgi:hypothetical protein